MYLYMYTYLSTETFSLNIHTVIHGELSFNKLIPSSSTVARKRRTCWVFPLSFIQLGKKDTVCLKLSNQYVKGRWKGAESQVSSLTSAHLGSLREQWAARWAAAFGGTPTYRRATMVPKDDTAII